MSHLVWDTTKPTPPRFLQIFYNKLKFIQQASSDIYNFIKKKTFIKIRKNISSSNLYTQKTLYIKLEISLLNIDCFLHPPLLLNEQRMPLR